MAYLRTFWIDEAVQYPDRFDMQTLPDGKVNLTASPGTIDTNGTPQSAKNFNNLEEGIHAANELGAELTRIALLHERTLNGLVGETGTTTLTNTLIYPFNNSTKTVSLITPRDTTDYTVSVDTGNAASFGRIVITDKLQNGFKIAFTGGAASLDVRYTITGGNH